MSSASERASSCLDCTCSGAPDQQQGVQSPKRFVGNKSASSGIVVRRSAGGAASRVMRQQVPDEILHNAALNDAIAVLPANYDFEIHKSVWRLRTASARRVALQFPEGLLMYACVIADILEGFAGVEHCCVLGDVTYGACCIDDLSAQALGCDFLIHYGHSCLVPVDVTRVPCLYVFVDIKVDIQHLVETIRLNWAPGADLVLAGTIQFSSSIQAARQRLADGEPSPPSTSHAAAAAATGGGGGDSSSAAEVAGGGGGSSSAAAAGGGGSGSGAAAGGAGGGEGGRVGCYPSLAIPQSKPLSPGEVLGCTAPVVAGRPDAIVFVADGRFHLEAMMIANPDIPAYRYDPYARVLTLEQYDQAGMRAVRRAAVEAARSARKWGLVLGTLGRQGNPRTLEYLQGLLTKRGLPYCTLLLSEISPDKLRMFGGVDAWVQIACPRLSIDWGEAFREPTLTPYEALVALGDVEPWWASADGKQGRQQQEENEVAAQHGRGSKEVAQHGRGGSSSSSVDPYPMDYYSRDGGVWNSSYHKKPAQRASAARRTVATS